MRVGNIKAGQSKERGLMWFGEGVTAVQGMIMLQAQGPGRLSQSKALSKYQAFYTPFNLITYPAILRKWLQQSMSLGVRPWIQRAARVIPLLFHPKGGDMAHFPTLHHFTPSPLTSLITLNYIA